MITTFPPFTAALDRRLRPVVAAPLAVGFSGGGDSLALLIQTLDWARVQGRAVVALTVDHQLNPASAAWTQEAVAKARALGAEARALAWTGDKPASGLPAAARAARHALLAQAAREIGARVLLLGHTGDDLAEAAVMRAEGSTVSDPREWSPSPAWPEGRGVFVLRPLLAVGRGAIRDWLKARGETWLEDPANDHPSSARARARARLGLARAFPSRPVSARREPSSAPSEEAMAAAGGQAGYLTLSRQAPAVHVAAACLCAAGTARPPRGERLQRLVDRIRAGETFTATLAGARIEAAGAVASFFREPGEARRAPGPVHGGRACFNPPVGQAIVWDGRYEIVALAEGLTIRPLQGLAARLPTAQRQALKGFPASARAALPAILDADGAVTCPILAEVDGLRARCLVVDRFGAAIGLVDQEPAT
jgi:tRNA(Ile)-lysidine synthase